MLDVENEIRGKLPARMWRAARKNPNRPGVVFDSLWSRHFRDASRVPMADREMARAEILGTRSLDPRRARRLDDRTWIVE